MFEGPHELMTAGVLTVGACYERWWLPVAEEELAPSSLAQYQQTWRRCIEPRWGRVAVGGVRPLDMQEWLLTLSRGSAEQACKILGRLLEYPCIFGLIDKNPMRVAYRLPRVARRRDKGVYTYAQLIERWRELEGTAVEPPFLLSAFGSARVGEALGVRLDTPGEVSFERARNGMLVACVAIERQVDHNGAVFSRLKTKCSRRTLVLAEPMSLRLRDLAEQGRARGHVWLASGGGRAPFSQQAFNRLWKASFIASKLPYHPFQNLRNSWRTFMAWEMGIDDSRLEKMMGHVGGSVTARYYDRPDTRLFVDTIAEAFSRYEGRHPRFLASIQKQRGNEGR